MVWCDVVWYHCVNQNRPDQRKEVSPFVLSLKLVRSSAIVQIIRFDNERKHIFSQAWPVQLTFFVAASARLGLKYQNILSFSVDQDQTGQLWSIVHWAVSAFLHLMYFSYFVTAVLFTPHNPLRVRCSQSFHEELFPFSAILQFCVYRLYFTMRKFLYFSIFIWLYQNSKQWL